SGGVPFVSFSNIPQTYTDLVIKISARTIRAADEDGLYMTINGQTSTGFADVEGNGGAATSVATAAYGNNWVSRINGNNSTANFFSNVDIYIANYTSDLAKSMSIDGVMENNSTTSYMNLVAALGASTSIGIRTLFFSCNANFMQHTTFHLYGVRAEI
ncbi:hypothetical protein UFOVP429_154, partial [uncultured Caudovirales phage]